MKAPGTWYQRMAAESCRTVLQSKNSHIWISIALFVQFTLPCSGFV